MISPSLEKSTKLSVSSYGVPVSSSRYLDKKLPIGDATVRIKKDDATVNMKNNMKTIKKYKHDIKIYKQVFVLSQHY